MIFGYFEGFVSCRLVIFYALYKTKTNYCGNKRKKKNTNKFCQRKSKPGNVFDSIDSFHVQEEKTHSHLQSDTEDVEKV